MCFFVIQASHLFRSQCVFTTKKCVFDENFSLSGRLYVQHWAVGASCGRSPGRWDTQLRKEEQEEEKLEEEEEEEMQEEEKKKNKRRRRRKIRRKKKKRRKT